MSGLILREEDSEHVGVSSYGPFVRIKGEESGGMVNLCLSTVPALIIALASLWREANPEDTDPVNDWLRNGVPTLKGRP